jgi:hypothetical protein
MLIYEGGLVTLGMGTFARPMAVARDAARALLAAALPAAVLPAAVLPAAALPAAAGR